MRTRSGLIPALHGCHQEPDYGTTGARQLRTIEETHEQHLFSVTITYRSALHR
jgi:hypothetical protein